MMVGIVWSGCTAEFGTRQSLLTQRARQRMGRKTLFILRWAKYAGLGRG